MQTIIAGRIETQERADELLAELRRLGVPTADMQAFYLTPPGQRASFPIGGDEHADPEAADAAKGQAKGAVAGAAAGLVAGGLAAAAVPPLAPVLLAGVTGVGALAGSIAGAVSAAGPNEDPARDSAQDDPARPGGLMVAARVKPDNEAAVLGAMRAAGASDIERACGEWRDGHWVDFDPTAPPQQPAGKS